MNNIINDIYIKNNFPSNERLFNLVKKDNNDITRNDIKSFLEKQKEHQILKAQHNIKNTGHLVAFEKTKYCKLIYLFYKNMRNKIKDIVIYLQQ